MKELTSLLKDMPIRPSVAWINGLFLMTKPLEKDEVYRINRAILFETNILISLSDDAFTVLDVTEAINQLKLICCLNSVIEAVCNDWIGWVHTMVAHKINEKAESTKWGPEYIIKVFDEDRYWNGSALIEASKDRALRSSKKYISFQFAVNDIDRKALPVGTTYQIVPIWSKFE